MLTQKQHELIRMDSEKSAELLRMCREKNLSVTTKGIIIAIKKNPEGKGIEQRSKIIEKITDILKASKTEKEFLETLKKEFSVQF